MTVTVTHTFVSSVADEHTAGEVGPDEWNAAHTLSGTLDAAQMPALTGDVTTPGASLATTLATVNGNVGTFGSASTAPVVTVNAKGLVTAASSTTIRERLSADRNYYVRSDGSDSNTGLVNNAGGAFLTVQKAVDVVSGTLDLNNHDVTINVTGTVAENIVLKTYLGATATVDANWGVPTGVKILGNRASLVLASAADNNHNLFDATTCKTPWIIDGFKMAGGSGNGLAHIQASGTPMFIGKVEFGDSPGVFSLTGDVRATEDYAISGGAHAHRFTGYSESLYVDSANYIPLTVTITNNPTFVRGFYVVDAGVIVGYGVTFTGTIVGISMYCVGNGVIETYGVGATYCPGTGFTQASGGQIL